MPATTDGARRPPLRPVADRAACLLRGAATPRARTQSADTAAPEAREERADTVPGDERRPDRRRHSPRYAALIPAPSPAPDRNLDTFVMPSWAKRPSPLSNPGGLLKLQWTRLRQKAFDLFQVVMYAKYLAKPRLLMNFRQTKPAAIALHRQMYSAFADADVGTLQKICVDGMLDSFRARIHARPRGEKMTWELVKYNGGAKVMSNRGARMPIEGSGLRQAIVRIRSRQRLTRYKVDGSVVPGSGKEKDVEEFVVIQRKLAGGKEEPWRVWGTTEETTLTTVEQRELEKMHG